MEFHVRNRWKSNRRSTVNRLYQKHVNMSGTVHSKAVEMWWKIYLDLVGNQRLQLKLTLLKWRKNRQLNKEYYLSTIKRLRKQIRRKRADLWKENSWFLHRDNAPSHKAIIVNKFLSKNSRNIIEQPPYSSDMAPADLKENSWRELKWIPEKAFKKSFDDWIIGRHKSIISGGVYFEGDKINLD